jgi:hypothetical protein
LQKPEHSGAAPKGHWRPSSVRALHCGPDFFLTASAAASTGGALEGT